MESAKRAVPRVRPVVVNGTRYEQTKRPRSHGFTQLGGVIAAVDDKTDEVLWMVQLYTTEYAGLEERDAQDVFVKELALDKAGQKLLATDTRNRIWSLDLATRDVVQVGEHDRP